MGTITSLLKTGANSTLNRIRSYDLNDHLSGISDALKVPKIEMPNLENNMKLNIDPSAVKLPAGVTNYISPLTSKLTEITNVKLPSEINGVSLPTLPDLSSVSSEVDNALSKFGFDTDKLGIRSVGDILKEPDLSSLKNVQFEQPVDLNNLPDITSSLDDFDMSDTQSQIDSLTNSIPGMESIDISKYF